MFDRFLNPLRAAILCIGLSSCNGGDVVAPPGGGASNIPTRLVKTGGDGQTQVVGSTLIILLSVRAENSSGVPVSGATVRYSLSSGSRGTVLDTVLVTDSLGRAGARFRLGTAPGVSAYAVEASIENVPRVTWQASAIAGQPSSAVQAGGTEQIGAAGDTSRPLRVRVVGATGTPIAGVPVLWSVTSGTASVIQAQGLTDTTGTASARVVIGGSAGSLRIQALAGTLAPVEFSLTVVSVTTLLVNISRDNTAVPSLSALGMTPIWMSSSFVASPIVNTKVLKTEVVVRTTESVGTSVGAVRDAAMRWESILRPLMSSGVALRIQAQPLLGMVRIELSDWQTLETAKTAVKNLWPSASVSPHFAQARRRAASEPWSDMSAETLGRYQAWLQRSISLEEAWSLAPKRGAGVIIGVVDDGIRTEHSDLATILTTDGYDFVSDGLVNRCGGGQISRTGDGGGYDPDPTQPTEYRYDGAGSCAQEVLVAGGHGLHVIGVLSGAQNGTGVVGVAPGAKVRAVRAFDVVGGSTDADIASAILYAAGLPVVLDGKTLQAAQGLARIINLSFEGPLPMPLEQAAVDRVLAAGVLVVSSSGNGGTDVLTYPSAYPGVVSVTSIGPDGRVANNATRGSWVTVAAPGGACPGAAQEAQTWSASFNFQTQQPTWRSSCGTSFAAPVVAGLAALIWAEEPNLTVSQLKERLRAASAPTSSVSSSMAEWGVISGAGIRTRRMITRVVAIDTLTKQIASTVEGPQTALSLRLPRLLPGAYWITAQDLAPDGISVAPWPTIRTGMARVNEGGVAKVVTVAQEGSNETSLTVSARERTPQSDSASLTSILLVGQAIRLSSSPAGTAGTVMLIVPTSGRVLIETDGLNAGCGLLGTGSASLVVLQESGTVLGNVMPRDITGCSALTLQLAPGRYRVRVTRQLAGPLVLRAVAQN